MKKYFLLLAILAFMLASRLIGLGDKPYHHDESLFAYYASQVASRGEYSHHALLHGPLQIQLIGLFLWLGDVLHLTGNGNATARLLAALSGIALLLPVWIMRRGLGRVGVWLAMGLIALSPGIWYYSRFCRNETLFLFAALMLVASVARAWRSPRPAGWIVGSVFFAAALVAIKENSLFILFNGLVFGLFILVHQFIKGRPALVGPRYRGLVSGLELSFKRYVFAWIIGLGLGWLLLEYVYALFFGAADRGFLGHYAEILAYWWGQHREHRLYGEFHYYLPILAVYESGLLLFLVLAIGWLYSRPGMLIAGALAFLLVALGLELGGISAGWFPILHFVPEFLKYFHMSHPWHLALAFFVGWTTLCATWHSLSGRRVFRAWLIWWTGLSFLQYSYAGEKVPWISLHIILPAILLTAHLADAGWRRLNARGWKIGIAVVVGLFLACNLFQGYRLCFVHPVYPGEILVYNHTQPEMHELGLRLGKIARESESARILLQGEANWPLFWYLHDGQYRFLENSERPSDIADMDYMVCDVEYLQDYPDLELLFDHERVMFRQAWVPQRLRLFTSIGHAENPDRADPALYGWQAWKSLWDFLVWREAWGDPVTTARPLEVLFLQRKDVSEPAETEPAEGESNANHGD
ncbi:MAG: flippase activity-associated protein Agl23 [Candidatus Sumerlaeia bacterium]